jgi:hypothetical protein
MARDPLTLATPGGILLHLASHLEYLGEAEEARAVAGRGLGWFQAHGSAALGDVFQMAQLHLFLDQPGEALDILRPVRTVGAEGLGEDYDWEIITRGTLGAALAVSGDPAGAQREADWLARLDHPYLRGLNTFYGGVVSAHLGQLDEAVELLRQAWEEGNTLTGWDYTHPLLVPLFDYEPYQRLVQPKG